MNDQLLSFIEFCLLDGVISEKEREVIFRKSEELGIPLDECEIILEGMLHKNNLKIVDSNQEEIVVKEKKSNYNPKPVPDFKLLNLTNSLKLKEEINLLESENSKLSGENKDLESFISKSIKEIEENSKSFLDSLKYGDTVVDELVVTDIVFDSDEINLYAKDCGTVTWDYCKNGIERINPELPHPFFVIYNYFETSHFKKYEISSNELNPKKESETQGGHLKKDKESGLWSFVSNNGPVRESIIPKKFIGESPSKVIIAEKDKRKIVFFKFKEDYLIVDLTYNVEFKETGIIFREYWILNQYDNKNDFAYWYSVARVDHKVYSKTLKFLGL